MVFTGSDADANPREVARPDAVLAFNKRIGGENRGSRQKKCRYHGFIIPKPRDGNLYNSIETAMLLFDIIRPPQGDYNEQQACQLRTTPVPCLRHARRRSVWCRAAADRRPRPAARRNHRRDAEDSLDTRRRMAFRQVPARNAIGRGGALPQGRLRGLQHRLPPRARSRLAADRRRLPCSSEETRLVRGDAGTSRSRGKANRHTRRLGWRASRTHDGSAPPARRRAWRNLSFRHRRPRAGFKRPPRTL